MVKTTFHISGMDCPSEEHMIRMKLEGFADIQSLQFDIPGRRLEVYHRDSYDPLLAALHSLDLGARLVSSEEIDTAGSGKSNPVQPQLVQIMTHMPTQPNNALAEEDRAGSTRTTFHISKMDCPSEENMIRMRLDGFSNVRFLEFDIPARRLEVYHTGGCDEVLAALTSLRLDTKLVSSEQAEMVSTETSHRQERNVLWQVLFINFFCFALEMLTGFIARSMGLVADSLDMLADSIVYALSLFAVGGTIARKKKVAGIAGYFQLALAVMGFAEVIRRFLGHEAAPDFHLMIVISVIALAGNAICLYLLLKSRSREAHMQASMIFTSNDVIVNLGVIVAGVIVYLTSSKLPDLVVGTIIFALVGRGAYRILQLSK